MDFDINTLRSLATVVSFVTFIGIVVWAYSGRNADDFESVSGSRPEKEVSLGITYQGRDVYAVFNRSPKGPAELVVTRDGHPIPAPLRGKDVRVNPQGQTFMTIDEPRMYYVITQEDSSTHELRFSPKSGGVRICSFTFGNRCLESFDRL